jgi:hypothetical protein
MGNVRVIARVNTFRLRLTGQTSPNSLVLEDRLKNWAQGPTQAVMMATVGSNFEVFGMDYFLMAF